MRKLGWYALRVTVAAFVLGSLLLLAANLYVQSHGVQQRIHDAAEGSLGMPIRLQKTTVTPWGGFRLDGIVLQPEDPDGTANTPGDRRPEFFTAASFRVRFAWWPLVAHQRVIVERVLLDQPHLAWQQDDDGHWSFPPGQDRVRLAEANELARENAEATAAGNLRGAPTPAPSSTPSNAAATPVPGSLPALEQSAAEPAEPATFAGFPMISRFDVRHGDAVIFDHDRHPLLHVEEINSDAAVTDPRHLKGAVWFAKAAVPSTGVALTDYRASVDFGVEEGLAVRDGRGSLAGGSLHTDFRLRPQGPGRTFSANCRLDDVGLGQLTSGSTAQPPLAEGRAFGNLECHGLTDDPTSRVGGGRFWLVGARLRDSAGLKLAGQILRISDLTHLEFKQADMDYKVEGTTLRIESVVLAANDVRVVARGTYLTDADQLDVHGRLTIDRAVSHQLPQFIESNFTPCGAESPGCRYLDFDVTGPADDPKSNLYDRLMAGPMKGLLDNLLAPKSKNPKNKTRGRETSAQPAPGATASP